MTVLVAGTAVGYWLYGDRLPQVVGRAARGAADKVTDVAAQSSERLDSPEGQRIAREEAARRAAALEARDRALGWVAVRSAVPAAAGPEASMPAVPATVAALRKAGGPAYVSLSARDVAGLVAPLVRQLPPSAQAVEVALNRDLLLLRADIALREVAGEGALSTVIGVALDAHDTLFLAGPLEPVRPGLAAFRVQELRVRGVDVPTRLIPGLVSTLRRRARYRVPQSDSLASDALPVPLPAYVSDARVVNGALTLYRAAGATSRTAP